MCSVSEIREILFLSGKSLQHVVESSRSSCRINLYIAPLISEILVQQIKLNHLT